MAYVQHVRINFNPKKLVALISGKKLAMREIEYDRLSFPSGSQARHFLGVSAGLIFYTTHRFALKFPLRPAAQYR